MLSRLFLPALLALAMPALAQQKNTASLKVLDKKDDVIFDYKKTGAPMPPMRLIPYYDTSSYIANTEQVIKDSIAHKKSKKHNKEVILDKSKVEITDKDINDGHNLFVMMFNPTCSHCEDQTERMEKNIAYFTKSKLILISTPQMKQYIPNFVKNFHSAEYPTITVGTDSSGFIDKAFLYQALPQINIYDADRKLIRIFSGEVAIDSLKQYIE